MGPPRRQQPISTTTTTTSQTTTTSVYLPQPQSEQTMPSGSQTPQPPSLGMTPASRYIYNLKVLRRRDPSILSIFDQFSHVCVYHHDGQKWDKHGYEGSMFLFERESYPPYGFYIMNRVGMEDYIQPLYPEDDLVHSGKFVIIRSYPDFLNNRLSSIKSAHPGEKLDKFSDVYSIPNIEQIDSKTKGRSSIVGLWMHADDSRDSLIDVMRRLHSYIKQNVSYPEDFRYGPGRPPPPHRLRAIPRKPAGTTSDTGGHLSQSDSENDQSYYSDAPAPSTSNGGLNAIDKLFSKLGPSPSVPLLSTSSKAQPATGLSLLNDIFASASSTPSSGALSNSATTVSPTTTQNATIFAPQPSIGSSGPQVLNSQVLTTILTGSAPSRAASVSSIVSHPSSREGDNEDDSQSDSPSTILDEDSDYQRSFSIQPATGSSAARLAGADLLSAFGLGVSRGQPKINGDVTPRPPNGIHRAPVPIESTSSIMTIKGSNHVSPPRPLPAPEPTQKPRANRPLVPFESDSELWPYNHKPTNDSSTTDDDNDIVELNFEDTSVLSDPEAFKRVLTQKRSAVSLRGAANGNGAGPHIVNGAASSSEKGKGRNRKKTKKEIRDAQDKAEIEKGWDQPTVTGTRGLGMEAVFGNHHASSSPSPSTSPAIGIVTREKASSSALASEMKTPTMTARMMPIPSANGPAVVGGAVSKGRGKLANGHAKVNGHSGFGMVDPDVLKDSMMAALDAQTQPIRSTDKNEFMREVAMLIHTDKGFAERLYQDYIARHP